MVLQITSRQKLVRRSDNGTNLLFLPNEQRRDAKDQRADPLEQLPEVKYSEFLRSTCALLRSHSQTIGGSHRIRATHRA